VGGATRRAPARRGGAGGGGGGAGRGGGGGGGGADSARSTDTHASARPAAVEGWAAQALADAGGDDDDDLDDDAAPTPNEAPAAVATQVIAAASTTALGAAVVDQERIHDLFKVRSRRRCQGASNPCSFCAHLQLFLPHGATAKRIAAVADSLHSGSSTMRMRCIMRTVFAMHQTPAAGAFAEGSVGKAKPTTQHPLVRRALHSAAGNRVQGGVGTSQQGGG